MPLHRQKYPKFQYIFKEQDWQQKLAKTFDELQQSQLDVSITYRDEQVYGSYKFVNL
jgi:hypothetical protein